MFAVSISIPMAAAATAPPNATLASRTWPPSRKRERTLLANQMRKNPPIRPSHAPNMILPGSPS